MGLFDLVRSLGGPKPVREVLEQTSIMLDLAGELLEDAVAYRRGERPDVTWEDLDRRDQEINSIQRENRRRLIRHLSVNPQADVGTALASMGLMKDIERVGDYSKSYQWVCQKESDGDLEEDLASELWDLEDRVFSMYKEVSTVYQTQEEEHARALLEEEQAVESRTDNLLEQLLKGRAGLPGQSSKLSMLIHYQKRITGHLGNIASSVALPLPYQDKDEPFEPEEES